MAGAECSFCQHGNKTSHQGTYLVPWSFFLKLWGRKETGFLGHTVPAT